MTDKPVGRACCRVRHAHRAFPKSHRTCAVRHGIKQQSRHHLGPATSLRLSGLVTLDSTPCPTYMSVGALSQIASCRVGQSRRLKVFEAVRGAWPVHNHGLWHKAWRSPVEKVGGATLAIRLTHLHSRSDAGLSYV
ncbi:hypothetical protein KEM48_010945 [Puccinia striiformis f. sp. tritici PST-130]|uniref:Uncharacterized protein n=1 Tax=Puccinia striiformis f. sp. tritici PST-78 TaxID=1165861 RepID=A0A0L0VWL6_9BASI|nr:hypothetical protein KEM48_010945 [Puccinia striiformis f. sp. tritici PST-130]KNF03666.1 hypothetical protein PSTG_03186 [Puccinia striiformis f. sp. tritici PST-78]